MARQMVECERDVTSITSLSRMKRSSLLTLATPDSYLCAALITQGLALLAAFDVITVCPIFTTLVAHRCHVHVPGKTLTVLGHHSSTSALTPALFQVPCPF